MIIDPFLLTAEPIDWQDLKDRPSLTRFREMLANRRLQHIVRMRNADPDTFQKIQGRIMELEDLLIATDPENNASI